jgi:hypothetical protein
MSLGVWLLVIGLCDLLRSARDVTTRSRRLLIVGIGTVLLLFAVVLLQPPGVRLPMLLLGWVSCFMLWLLGSAAALQRDAAVFRALAFLGLGGGVALGVVFDPRFSELPGGAPGMLSGWPVDQVTLVAGVAAVQLATANVAVRLVLDAVGVPASTNEKKLKGGRLLGPMERLLIVGLGLAGEVTAASIVVAAKGLLRFPELQRDSKLAGPSDVTEYFLIGSFASWIAALGGLALVALGQM